MHFVLTTRFAAGAYILVSYDMLVLVPPDFAGNRHRYVVAGACFYNIVGGTVCLVWPYFLTSQALLSIPLLANIAVIVWRWRKFPESDGGFCRTFLLAYFLYAAGLMFSLCVTLPDTFSAEACYHVCIIICVLFICQAALQFFLVIEEQCTDPPLLSEAEASGEKIDTI